MSGMLQKIKKQQQLLSRLQALVHDANSDSSTTHEVMDYFLKRLSSTQASNRALATKVRCLKMETLKLDESLTFKMTFTVSLVWNN